VRPSFRCSSEHMAARTNRRGWFVIGAIGMTLHASCAVAARTTVRRVATCTIGVMRLVVQCWQRAWLVTGVACWRFGNCCAATRRTRAVRFVAIVATIFDITMWAGRAIRVTTCALRHRRCARVWFMTASAGLVTLRRRRRFNFVTRLTFGHVALRRMLLLMATSTGLVTFVHEFALVGMTSCTRRGGRLGCMRRMATSACIVATAGGERSLRFVTRLASRNARLREAVRFVTRRALRVAEVERHVTAGFVVTATARNGFAWRLRSQRARRWMDVVALFAVGDLVVRMHVGMAALATVASRSFRVMWVVAAIAQTVRLRGELAECDLGGVTRLATCNVGFFEDVRLVTADARIVFTDDDCCRWYMRCFDLWILVTTRAARRCDARFFVRLMAR